MPDTYDPVTARMSNSKLQEAYNKTKSNLSSVEGRLIESFLLDSIVDEDEVSKYKVRTGLIRKLREEPTNLKYKGFSEAALYTQDKREELIKIVKDNSRKNFGKDMNKSEFIGSLKKDIDYHYEISRSVINLDKAGNVISLTRNNIYYR